MCLSLSKNSYAKNNSMGYAKKTRRGKEKKFMPKGMREKNACQRAGRKEKKKKERNKDSPYF